MEVDEALAKLGAIGRWQILYYTVISTGCWVIPCLHTLAIIYIGNCTSLYNTRIVSASLEVRGEIIRTVLCCIVY